MLELFYFVFPVFSHEIFEGHICTSSEFHSTFKQRIEFEAFCNLRRERSILLFGSNLNVIVDLFVEIAAHEGILKCILKPDL